MGLLVEGVWHDQWYDTKSTGGKFKRQQSQFRQHITADGSSGFKAEADRYHLYVSLACPWASRVVIFRALKKLQSVISMSVVDPYMGENGWMFSDGPGCVPDTLNNATFMHEIYTKADPHYSGRVTVPVLWDKQQQTIVNNESAEIIRMLNSEFNALTDHNIDYYPSALRADIDAINETVYQHVNNGVYKVGFATEQTVYHDACIALFDHLDQLDHLLEKQTYLVGEQITEADWRLFTTLIRFDAVYVGHFKCNKKRLLDYPNLHRYLWDLYEQEHIAETVNFDHIKQHYYRSHPSINPTGIVPLGPDQL